MCALRTIWGILLRSPKASQPLPPCLQKRFRWWLWWWSSWQYCCWWWWNNFCLTQLAKSSWHYKSLSPHYPDSLAFVLCSKFDEDDDAADMYTSSELDTSCSYSTKIDDDDVHVSFVIWRWWWWWEGNQWWEEWRFRNTGWKNTLESWKENYDDVFFCFISHRTSLLAELFTFVSGMAGQLCIQQKWFHFAKLQINVLLKINSMYSQTFIHTVEKWIISI